MPALSKNAATRELATTVREAKQADLKEIAAELFPEQPSEAPTTAEAMAHYISNGLEAEEIVDLWNVVFPADRNVWYNEQEEAIHYDRELVGSTETE